MFPQFLATLVKDISTDKCYFIIKRTFALILTDHLEMSP